MKKEIKVILIGFLLIFSWLSFYFYVLPIDLSKPQSIWIFLLIIFIALASFLAGSINNGKAVPLRQLNKGEKVKILASYHPANYKLGDKRNKSYYLLERGVDGKIYLFIGEENYSHLPYRKFHFIWNGQELIPFKQ